MIRLWLVAVAIARIVVERGTVVFPRVLVIAGCVLLALAGPGWCRPAQVLLMRHGHKGGSASDYNLSPLGFQRALDLASVIPSCFGAPSHITTYFLDPDTSKNARSYQTAVPLAVASGVNIRIDTSSVIDSQAVGERIRRDREIKGGLMVIFWEHRHLPALAAGLGWPAMPPIADDDFDKLYQLIYSQDSAVPTVIRYSQSGLVNGSQPCTMAMPVVHSPTQQ